MADQQIAEISGLLPLRERLLRLMEDLPSKMQEHHRAQLADAIRLGLEKQVPSAQALLTGGSSETTGLELQAESAQQRAASTAVTAIDITITTPGGTSATATCDRYTYH